MSIITWQNLPQTNFTDSNHMTQVAMQAWDNALKTAQDTVANAGASIKNQNEAKLVQFINSIDKDHWQASQEQINDTIAQMANQTGTMFDPKVIEAYRDGRGNTLIARDNTRLQNEEMTLTWDNKQQTDLANKTVQELIYYDEVIKNSTGQDKIDAQTAKDTLMEKIATDPIFAGRVTQDYVKQHTDHLTNQDKHTDAQMLPDMADITTLSAQLYDAISKKSLLTPPSENATQEQKQAYQTNVNHLNEIIQTTSALLKPYSKQYGEGKINQVYKQVAEQAQEQHIKLYGTPIQREGLALKQRIADATIVNNAAKLALDIDKFDHTKEQDVIQTNAKLYGLMYGNGGEGSGSGKASTQSNQFSKELVNLGLGTVYDPKADTLDIKALGTGIINNLNKITSKNNNSENKQSFNEWKLSKEGADTIAGLYDESFWGGQWTTTNRKFQNIEQAFNHLEASGEKLTEQEKIAVTTALSVRGSEYARQLFAGKNDTQTAIKNALADIRTGKDKGLDSEKQAYLDSVLNTVGTARGLSELETYVYLKNEGGLPAWVLDLRPDLKNQAIAQKQLSTFARKDITKDTKVGDLINPKKPLGIPYRNVPYRQPIVHTGNRSHIGKGGRIPER